MIVKIFVNPLSYSIDKVYQKEENELCIGVDKGAYYALQKGINLELALGDFDSVSQRELAYIKKHAKKTQTHAIRKDKTDSDLAISEALKLHPDRIEVYGGIGKRLDHTYGNLMFLKRGNIILRTDDQKAFVLEAGSYGITHDYDYISFFAIEPVKKLTLRGFSFEIKDYDLAVDDPLCISNQGEGVVSFEKGRLLVIQAND